MKTTRRNFLRGLAATTALATLPMLSRKRETITIDGVVGFDAGNINGDFTVVSEGIVLSNGLHVHDIYVCPPAPVREITLNFIPGDCFNG